VTHPGPTLVVGVGSGLGAAVARAFAGAGAPVALGARRPEFISGLAREIREGGGRALAVPYDATDEGEVAEAIRRATGEVGPIRHLVYNVGQAAWGPLEEVTPEAFLASWKSGAYGAYLHARHLIPAMVQEGGGSVIFTGATSAVHSPGHSPAFGSAKFALRGLAMSLMRAWGPKGVHVSHVIIDGAIGGEGVHADEEETLSPRSIADECLHLALQDPSAWTFELDLRPFTDPYLEN